VIFRGIEKSDIEPCALLFMRVFSSTPWSEGWSAEAAFERLNHFYQSKGFVGVLAETDDVVGFSLGNIEPFFFGSMFYLREMCTEASLQNQGVGRRILCTLEKELNSSSVKSIYLTTERSIPAANFYQNNGFTYSEKMGFYTKSGLLSQ